MTNLENYQLVHPELLTEDTLLNVLRDRCIEVPQLRSTNKAELVEIFKRVAMPLPQRRYDDGTYLGRKLIGLRKMKRQREVDLPEIAPTPSGAESSSQNILSCSERVGRIADRLKPPLTSLGTESKKIRLSKPLTIPRKSCDTGKRRGEEESPGCEKRQKITWP